jgi:hypothetical protein
LKAQKVIMEETPYFNFFLIFFKKRLAKVKKACIFAPLLETNRFFEKFKLKVCWFGEK